MTMTSWTDVFSVYKNEEMSCPPLDSISYTFGSRPQEVILLSKSIAFYGLEEKVWDMESKERVQKKFVGLGGASL